MVIYWYLHLSLFTEVDKKEVSYNCIYILIGKIPNQYYHKLKEDIKRILFKSNECWLNIQQEDKFYDQLTHPRHHMVFIKALKIREIND